MNCPSVGSLLRGAAPQNRLLHSGCPTGSQVLPGACSNTGLPMGSQPPLGIPLLCCGVFHRVQVGICSSVGLHGCRGQPASPWAAPWAAGESAPASGARPALLLHPPCSLQRCCSHIISLLYPAAICAGLVFFS